MIRKLENRQAYFLHVDYYPRMGYGLQMMTEVTKPVPSVRTSY